jgi:hypothetical protein
MKLVSNQMKKIVSKKICVLSYPPDQPHIAYLQKPPDLRAQKEAR